ncbi:hypothetical protein BDN72DRAFT_145109 [Pluteus cervinus]|uniref:Uncharacterized protein n=1 Tax=Pluteus cervinus TaxID=181527 RepID=A0ACD3ALX9_9AGAR|nr:hypothetical protein BDN72DRAFT_145109 [Pluteus cervinus]
MPGLDNLVTLADVAVASEGVLPTCCEDELQLRKLHERRQALADRALSLPTTYRQRATPEQNYLFKQVFEEITPYPSTHQIYVLILLSGRSYNQIQSWFKTERQNCPPKNLMTVITEEKDTIRIRDSIYKPWVKWSDRLFKITAEKFLPDGTYHDFPLSDVHYLLNLKRRFSGGASRVSSDTQES